MVWKIILCAVIAYLIGSINIAVILSKAVFHKDVREYGSKNAGSTNMIRTFGWPAGIATFIGDIFKGIVAVLFGKFICGDVGIMVSSIALVIGNDWPVFFKFKGGKGVAVTAGALLTIMPIPIAAIILLCFAIIAITRIVSIASIIGGLLIVVAAIVFKGDNPYVWIAVIVMALLLIFQHRENIKRILTKSENKI